MRIGRVSFIPSTYRSSHASSIDRHYLIPEVSPMEKLTKNPKCVATKRPVVAMWILPNLYLARGLIDAPAVDP